jgi:hypothetical protein
MYGRADAESLPPPEAGDFARLGFTRHRPMCLGLGSAPPPTPHAAPRPRASAPLRTPAARHRVGVHQEAPPLGWSDVVQ